MSELEKHHVALTSTGRSSEPEVRHQPLTQRSKNSLAQVAYEFCTEINDILNAAALRLALLRWQPNGEHSEGDIVRLAKMIDQAGSLVRWLQDRSFAALGDRHRHGPARTSGRRDRKRFG